MKRGLAPFRASKYFKKMKSYLLSLPVLFFLLLSPVASAKTFRLVALGDSLTEGYGVPQEKAYPAQLEKLLKTSGKTVQVINAGISGATTASGPKNLSWQLRQPIDLLILCLGANDFLRGLSATQAQANLEKTILLAKEHSVPILLVGMKLPRNLSPKYIKDFEGIYPALVKKHQLSYSPFLLEGVATIKKLNLSDGIHPNEKGYEKVAKHLLPFVLKALPKGATSANPS